jgi:hypothetical protein
MKVFKYELYWKHLLKSRTFLRLFEHRKVISLVRPLFMLDTMSIAEAVKMIPI